jgi:copper chaperone CopZ
MSQNETVRDYTVKGMTCEHCVLSVTEEVSEVPGVENVDVDLGSGRLVVLGDVADEAIRAAVAEAGYEVDAIGSETDDRIDTTTTARSAA